MAETQSIKKEWNRLKIKVQLFFFPPSPDMWTVWNINVWKKVVNVAFKIIVSKVECYYVVAIITVTSYWQVLKVETAEMSSWFCGGRESYLLIKQAECYTPG